MSEAYADTSALLAVALGEPGGPATIRSLDRFDRLFASNLLEAELRAALHREGVSGAPEFLDALSWVLPTRPLSPEIGRVLAAGSLRGADLWHLATALYLATEPASLTFISIDEPQRTVAKSLGFPIEPVARRSR